MLKLYHCLNARQFDREFLDYLYLLTNKIRQINKSKQGALFLQSLLPHKKGMLYFIQPSTRTYLSFKVACQILGIQVCDVRDERTSSTMKGESFQDTIRTFSSYADFIIMRHKDSNVELLSKEILDNCERPIPIINAGSGKDQHPTQALLDIYTLRQGFVRHSQNLKNKTILFCGDLLRGRTVRSLCQLLAHFEKIKIIFAAPKVFQIGDDIVDYLREHKIAFEKTQDFLGNISKADAIYMTRIQDEHDSQKLKSTTVDLDQFSLKKVHLELLKKNCLILHPLPRRTELEASIDNDQRAIYWRQERNGMWTRVALISIIFGVDRSILSYAE